MKSFQEDFQLSFHTRWIHQVNKHICGGCQNEFQHSADFSDHLLSNQCKSKDKNLQRGYGMIYLHGYIKLEKVV